MLKGSSRTEQPRSGEFRNEAVRNPVVVLRLDDFRFFKAKGVFPPKILHFFGFE